MDTRPRCPPSCRDKVPWKLFLVLAQQPFAISPCDGAQAVDRRGDNTPSGGALTTYIDVAGYVEIL